MGGDKVTTKNLELRLTEHLTQYKLDRKEYKARQLHQDKLQEDNLTAIKGLTTATKGLVELWTVANSLNTFLIWISKVSIVGGFITYTLSKLLSKEVLQWLNSFI